MQRGSAIGIASVPFSSILKQVLNQGDVPGLQFDTTCVEQAMQQGLPSVASLVS